MPEVISQDGTRIAFERVGEGPPLILVVGAFNDRSTGAPLAASLADRTPSSPTTAAAGATAGTRRRTRSSARSRTSAP